VKSFICLSLVVVFASLILIASAPKGYSQNMQVNFGVTFRNARLMPLWIAEEEGYFKKEGLDVKQVLPKLN